MFDLRSSLARARGLGSAKDGTKDFWRQRVTSVLGLPLLIGVIIVIVANVGADYETAVTRLGHPLVSTLLLLALLNFCVHMRIGMQVIIEDYVHGTMAKPLFLMANTGFTALIGAAGAVAILKIAMSG